MIRVLFFILFISPFGFSQLDLDSFGESQLIELFHQNQIEKFDYLPRARNIRVAILDGSEEIGPIEFKNSKFINASIANIDPQKNIQDNHMPLSVQLYLGLLQQIGKIASSMVEVYVLPAHTFSDIKNSIHQAIELDIDLVVHPNVWETLGFGENDSYLRPYIDEAIDSGIFWLNAAGNFQNMVYKGAILPLYKGFVDLDGPNDSLEILCHHRPSEDGIEDGCELKVALVWDDFKLDDGNNILPTHKDLDLLLYDEAMNLVASSKLVQFLDPNSLNVSKESISNFPSERLTYKMQSGHTYRLKIAAQSSNFTAENWFRVTVAGDFVELLTKPKYDIKRLIAPADHPNVIVFGDSSSRLSSRNDRNERLILDLMSKITLNSKSGVGQIEGSSGASIVGAVMFTRLLMADKDAYYKDQLRNQDVSKDLVISHLINKFQCVLKNNPNFVEHNCQ